MFLLVTAALSLCTFAALYSRRERRKLQRMLEDDDVVIYVHLEVDSDALPLDVWSKHAEAMRDNANWN